MTVCFAPRFLPAWTSRFVPLCEQAVPVGG
jgi:hypothetical protein